jgi:hypothetical protein
MDVLKAARSASPVILDVWRGGIVTLTVLIDGKALETALVAPLQRWLRPYLHRLAPDAAESWPADQMTLKVL